MDKELETIESVESIIELENIIKNPNTKINELIKPDFNGYYLDLVLTLTQFLINKDRTIEKTNKEIKFKNFLFKKYIQDYYKNCGEQEFTDEINRIRNNIGHGKYIIDKETLGIKLLNSDEIIDYQYIRPLIENLFIDNKNKLEKLPIKTGYIEKIKDGKLDIDNIEDMLSKYRAFEFNMKSESNNFDGENLSFVQTEISKYEGRIKEIYSSEELSKKYINSIKTMHFAASSGNFEFEHKAFNLNELPDNILNNLKTLINENYDILKKSSDASIQAFIDGFMKDFYFDKDDILQMDKAFTQISTLARAASHNKDLSYNELKEKYYLLPPTGNQMLLATTLAKFNMLYSYNADTIFRDYLDFSKLDLSKLEPTINVNNHEKLIEPEKRKIISLEKENKKKYKTYMGMKNIPNPDAKKIEITNNINLKIYDNLFEILEQKEIIKEKQFSKNEKINDEALYSQNKEIISHLRNSITHGNIEILSRIKNNDLSTCVLKFKDYDIVSEKQTFELTTTLETINSLCDYKKTLEKLHENDNYTKVMTKQGFANVLILISIMCLELSTAFILMILLNK